MKARKEDQKLHSLAGNKLPSPDPSLLHQEAISDVLAQERNVDEHEEPNAQRSDSSSSSEQPPPKRRKLASHQDLSHVARKLQQSARGIFTFPSSSQLVVSTSEPDFPLPELPPKALADKLIFQYKHAIHPTLPIIYWNSFVECYEMVYQDGSFKKVPRVWVGLLFMVMAVGALHLGQEEGSKYLEISRSLVDMWANDLTLDHIRTALLASIFLVELNLKSAGWIWLGIATQAGYDLGLHCEAGSWPAVEEEMRRRLWWCIYVYDWYVRMSTVFHLYTDINSLLCMELGRPAMIREDDCKVQLPSPADDQFIRPELDWTHPSPGQASTRLLPAIKIAGGISRLLQYLKSSHLTEDSLDAYNTYYEACMAALPFQDPTRIQDYIDPLEVHPALYLQNARLLLYRHSLSPLHQPHRRTSAIDKCAAIARETVHILRRCMLYQAPDVKSEAPSHNGRWESQMLLAASAFLCTHIWRCALFLCMRLDFSSALVCARVGSVIGATRPVNVACGRHMLFFVKELVSKWTLNPRLDEDEEMIAYVSGDLQGSFENSWIWRNTKNDIELENLQSSKNASHETTLQTLPENGVSAQVTDEDTSSGWEHVIRMLDRCQKEIVDGHSLRALNDSYSASNSMDAHKESVSPVPAGAQAASSRMSIRDLI